jgi:hypothetical protein
VQIEGKQQQEKQQPENSITRKTATPKHLFENYNLHCNLKTAFLNDSISDSKGPLLVQNKYKKREQVHVQLKMKKKSQNSNQPNSSTAFLKSGGNRGK